MMSPPTDFAKTNGADGQVAEAGCPDPDGSTIAEDFAIVAGVAPGSRCGFSDFVAMRAANLVTWRTKPRRRAPGSRFSNVNQKEKIVTY